MVPSSRTLTIPHTDIGQVNLDRSHGHEVDGARWPFSARGVQAGVGAENPVTSCDLHVLVYEATQSTPSQWTDGRAGGRGDCDGRAGAAGVIGAGGECCEVGPGRGSGLSTRCNCRRG